VSSVVRFWARCLTVLDGSGSVLCELNAVAVADGFLILLARKHWQG
jgi:hypothetical protein